MPFAALVCITGTLVLSLALRAYGQITTTTTTDGMHGGVASILVGNSDSGTLDEFAFTDEEQGRFNWIVSATDLPWIGAYRFQPSTSSPTTLLLSVSDTSGVALAQCAFPRGGGGGVSGEENEWTEFVWSLQADSLHCNVSTSASRFRFPLRAVPRKRYVVRVSAIEGPRCIAGLMIRNQKPTGCPPRFQRVVFVSQGFNCGCPPRIAPESPSIGTLRPDLQQEQPEHNRKQTPVAFPRFEPATSGLFDPTTAAPFVDDLTSPPWLSHLSGGSVAQVAPTVTEVVVVRESSPEWPQANPHINTTTTTTTFPFPVWTNSSRATISPVNNSNSNPVRTTVDVARASTTPLPPTTAKATTKTTTAAATTIVARRTTTTPTTTTTSPPTTPRSSTRAKGQSPAGGRNATAFPSLTSSGVDLVDVTSGGAASTPGHTSTTPTTTAPVDGVHATAPNIAVTCSETSCQNNGTCVVVSAAELLCICPPGFNGTHCEFALPCASNPCQNGGVCEPVDDSFRCDCPPNTSGELCDSYLCDNECYNGGVCIVDEHQFTKCNCTPGFLGYNCNLIDVCNGAVTPCDVFGPTATCEVVDEHASPFLVNATYQCLCPDGNNGQVECASLLNTTPVTADMSSAITTSAPLSTSTMTSARATSTSSPATLLTTGWTTSTSTLTTQVWSTTTSILAETTTTATTGGGIDAIDTVNTVEERARAGPIAPTTIALVVVGIILLLVVLFLASLLSVRFVRRSRKLHGKYNPAKEESMVGAGLSLPMATINKEERLI